MPISLPVPVRRISQPEFADLSFEVMRHVFAIHNEIGRFFDEKIYKRELANRLPGVQLEIPIDLTFRSFQKRYFIDVLVNGAGIFEFKAVDSLAGRHRAQLLNYLLLCDLFHGKLINVRPEDIQHEFVNTHWLHSARTCFDVDSTRWNASLPGSGQLHDFLTAFLHDLGTGLALELYDEAVEGCFGGIDRMEADVGVEIGGRQVGQQRFRLITSDVAVKITGLDGPLGPFEVHARRLLAHVNLRAIAWVNINMKKVTLVTLER